MHVVNLSTSHVRWMERRAVLVVCVCACVALTLLDFLHCFLVLKIYLLLKDAFFVLIKMSLCSTVLQKSGKYIQRLSTALPLMAHPE